MSKTLRLVLWTLATLGFLAAGGLWTASGPLGAKVFATLAAASAYFALLQGLNLFFWEPYRRRKHLKKVPSLMREGLHLVLGVLTFLGLVSGLWGVSIEGLLAATGVVGLVVGLALKELISDIFSGIIIALDKTVSLGDFVRIENRNFEEKRGTVIEMNWRTVRIKTPDNVLVVVPNTFVANNLITNLSQSDEGQEFEVPLTFDFQVPSERILRILDAALAESPSVRSKPAPSVRISKVTAAGVEYKLQYTLSPEFPEPGKARHQVLLRVLHHLTQAGVSPSYPKQDLFTAPMPQRTLDTHADRPALVRRVPLFSGLDDGLIAALAGGLTEQKVPRGEDVVRVGEAGDSLYILVEGLLEVLIPDGHGGLRSAVKLNPGAYFGEMALLTGEPRSATVRTVRESILYRIEKDQVDALLRQSPDLLGQLSQKMADLKYRSQELPPEARTEDPKGALTGHLMGLIADFFRLK